MKKRVLSIGQCGPDHTTLSAYLGQHFDVEIVAADQWQDAERLLDAGPFDLVLVNRKLDIDYSDGLEIIRRIKDDPRFADVPCMMITNYAEHQQAAVEAGAAPGFGKNDYGLPETREKLAAFLA